MTPQTVVLVHPSRLFSDALARVLNNPPFRLGYSASGVDCIPFEVLQDSTLFLVGGLPPTDISSTVRAIKQRLSSALVVVIGDTSKPEAILMTLEAGANAYFREAMTSQTLLRGLELVLDDEIILPPEVVRYLSGQPTPLGEQQLALDSSLGELPFLTERIKDAHLSPREATILQALIEGASNKVIAQHLDIAVATVKVHVAALLRKIHAKNRTQAAVWALKHPGNGADNKPS